MPVIEATTHPSARKLAEPRQIGRKNMRLPLLLALFLLLAAYSPSARAAQAVTCDELAGQRFGDALIEQASVASPSNGVDPETRQVLNASFCRVRGAIRPTPGSNIRFEVWLPPLQHWNGKYEGVGNGGFAGTVPFANMNHALEQGYAVSGTDTGHADTTGESRDTQWAIGHPDLFIDYGWRAIHETAVASRNIVQAYYAQAPAHAYFVGCSTGGRQALIEAQRFPRDYDGIVAGAPGNYMTSLLTLDLALSQAADSNPTGWFSREKLMLLHNAVLRDCHGVAGLLEDPSACRFDPAQLRCRARQTASCFTAADVAMARQIYAGLRAPSGQSIYPGFQPGGELSWNWGADSRLRALAVGFFGDIVTATPNWNINALSPSEALDRGEHAAGSTLDAVDADLRPFYASGGKLIQYHGWNDPRIPPQGSIRYYQATARELGGDARTRSFYRLFMAPGMEHCSGGPGPNAIGGSYGLPAPNADAEHDVVAALSRWVEEGVAPNYIIATLYSDNNPSKGVAAQHPWCAFPAVARYLGRGDRSQASNYGCRPPQ
jgi:feruloyl esterase